MPFDLDALIAERDALTPFTFTFDGNEYTMPSDVDVAVLDLLTKGEIAPALEQLLGPDQWAEIVASPKVLGISAASALVGEYVEHLGASDLGESVASTRSLKSTARPSKRTSKGSTRSVSVISEPGSPGVGSAS